MLTDIDNWNRVKTDIDKRHELIIDAEKRLHAQFPNSNTVALAATDVFVEKAQLALTIRAKKMVYGGIAAGIFGTLLLIVAAIYVGYLDNSQSNATQYNYYTFTIKLIRMTTLSAFILGAVVWLLGLSKSLLHEAMVLYNRRHALRFGRLFLYTQNGNANLEKITDSFEWNSEYTSAFKDLKPESMSKTLLHKIFELPPDTLRAAGDFLRSTKEKGKSDKI